MRPCEPARVESDSLSDFARALELQNPVPTRAGEPRRRPAPRLNLERNQAKNGLGQLVLTLVKLLHELLERQAIRRVESRSLSPEQIEKLGLTLMQQSREIDRLRTEFGLEEEDLNLDPGPLGRLL